MAPAAAPARSGGLMAKKVGGIPVPALIAVGVAAVAGIYYLRKKNAATAAAAPPTQQAAAGTGAATTPYGPAGGGGIDGNTLAAILASQGAGSTASTTAPGYTPPTGQTLVGAGYQQASGQSTVSSASGSSIFAPVLNSSQANSIAAGGGTLWYQPQPGIFAPIPGNNYAGIPTFSLVSGTGQ